MNDTTNNPNGGNSFNNSQNNNPRPNSVPPVNLPTGNPAQSSAPIDLTPKFSGMPSAQQASRPVPTPIPVPPKPQVQAPMPQAPRPNPVPAPAPQPMQKPPVFNPGGFPISGQVAPRPTPVSQFVGSKSPAPKGSSNGLLALIVIVIIILLAGGALWLLNPSLLSNVFKSGGDTGNNIEDKVGDNNNKPKANDASAFPTGVLNTTKPSSTTTKTVITKPSSPTYSSSDQSKVTDYLKANINKLARTTGYSVVEITFDGPQRSIVTYSNGRVTYSAVVNAYIDSTGNVKVTDFTVLTK